MSLLELSGKNISVRVNRNLSLTVFPKQRSRLVEDIADTSANPLGMPPRWRTATPIVRDRKSEQICLRRWSISGLHPFIQGLWGIRCGVRGNICN